MESSLYRALITPNCFQFRNRLSEWRNQKLSRGQGISGKTVAEVGYLGLTVLGTAEATAKAACAVFSLTQCAVFSFLAPFNSDLAPQLPGIIQATLLSGIGAWFCTIGTLETATLLFFNVLPYEIQIFEIKPLTDQILTDILALQMFTQRPNQIEVSE